MTKKAHFKFFSNDPSFVISPVSRFFKNLSSCLPFYRCMDIVYSLSYNFFLVQLPTEATLLFAKRAAALGAGQKWFWKKSSSHLWRRGGAGQPSTTWQARTAPSLSSPRRWQFACVAGAAATDERFIVRCTKNKHVGHTAKIRRAGAACRVVSTPSVEV